jgi:hypothetical protein
LEAERAPVAAGEMRPSLRSKSTMSGALFAHRALQVSLVTAVLLTVALILAYGSNLGREAWFLPVMCAQLWTTFLVAAPSATAPGAWHPRFTGGDWSASA